MQVSLKPENATSPQQHLRLLIMSWILGKNSVDTLVVFGSKVKRCLLIVVLGVAMITQSTRSSGLTSKSDNAGAPKSLQHHREYTV